ncbi:MAG: signal transduction histidine kinase [Rickettsiales bacterium]|jgi:signal transduction histidine kinase
MEKEKQPENPEYDFNPKGEEEKCDLLKKSLFQMKHLAFLCQITPENPNFLEIVECNNNFLNHFRLKREEVVGHNYDFLLANENIEQGSNRYFEYINLIKIVGKLQANSLKMHIPHPREENKSESFRINFTPSRYKTRNIYCIFSFKLLEKHEHDETPKPLLVIQNLERTIKNERLLRSMSDLIASGSDLKETAGEIIKTICHYLKVDRCIFYDANPHSGFIAEYCTKGAKKISIDADSANSNSPINRYINFQNNLFLEANHLKKTTTTLVCEDVNNDSRFESIEDLYSEFGIISQIAVVITSNNVIIGGFYLQQSTKRNWIREEWELIEIVSNQLATAIDRSNYTYQLLTTNKELAEKSDQLNKSLLEEKRMRELQSEFVALVSHEFKTPLQIIDSSRELLLRKMKAKEIIDENIENYLGRIKNNVLRMNNLIQSNLNLSKIEIGEEGIKVDNQTFNIKALIKEIIEKNFNFMQEKRIRVELDINSWPDYYDGDLKLLDHSFSNVITNAIKYSKVNSPIQVTGKIENGKLHLRVVDFGIGIPDDDLKKIGKKFFRAQNTLSIAGTGIGIYLTEYFVGLHNGSVLIESQLGIGTTINIYLPISQ